MNTCIASGMHYNELDVAFSCSVNIKQPPCVKETKHACQIKLIRSDRNRDRNGKPLMHCASEKNTETFHISSTTMKNRIGTFTYKIALAIQFYTGYSKYTYRIQGDVLYVFHLHFYNFSFLVILHLQLDISVCFPL